MADHANLESQVTRINYNIYQIVHSRKPERARGRNLPRRLYAIAVLAADDRPKIKRNI